MGSVIFFLWKQKGLFFFWIIGRLITVHVTMYMYVRVRDMAIFKRDG